MTREIIPGRKIEGSTRVSWEFNVPFQHKCGYIRDEKGLDGVLYKL